MVSQAYNFLTKFWSFSIFLTLNANDKVTAKGSPSGIATTITVIPIIKNFNILPASPSYQLSFETTSMVNLNNRINTIKEAEYKPKTPISSAILDNFYYKGVVESS